MTTYTDTQLKQALAKMLPERIKTFSGSNNLLWITGDATYPPYKEVLDTELLHLCWLVEEQENHTKQISFIEELREIVLPDSLQVSPLPYVIWRLTHATWQQRTIALAKVLNIEII